MTAEHYAEPDILAGNREGREAKLYHIGLTIGALAADDCRSERRYELSVSSNDLAAITAITDWFYGPKRTTQDHAAGTFLLQRAANHRENGMDIEAVVADAQAFCEHYQTLFSEE